MVEKSHASYLVDIVSSVCFLVLLGYDSEKHDTVAATETEIMSSGANKKTPMKIIWQGDAKSNESEFVLNFDCVLNQVEPPHWGP